MRTLLPLLFAVLQGSAGCSRTLAEPPPEPEEARLALLEPHAAAWLPAGTTRVTGRAEHLTRLTANGVPARVDDRGAFTADVELARGVQLLEVRGDDRDGSAHAVHHAVLVGDFGDPSDPVPDALRLRLNRRGIDTTLEAMARAVDSEAVAAGATASNPVYEDSYGVLGWSAVSVRADLVHLALGDPTLGADPREGGLDLAVSVPDLDVAAVVSGTVLGWPFTVDVALWATRADVAARLTIDAVDGGLQAGLLQPLVTLRGFGYDTSLLPGLVEEVLLVGQIRSFLEDFVANQLLALVPPLLDQALRGLDTSFEAPVLDRRMAVDARFTRAALDREGLAVDLDIDVVLPRAGTVAAAGYLLSGDAPPRLDRLADLSVAVSDDLVNRLAYEIWRAGLLTFELGEVDGSLPGPIREVLGAPGASVTVSTPLPPVVVEHAGNTEIRIGEVDVTVRTPGGELGQHLRMAVHLAVPVVPEVRDGRLRLALGEPRMLPRVRESDWVAPDATIAALAPTIVPVGVLTDVLAELEIALPTVLGLILEDTRVERQSERWTAVELTLR